MNISILKKVIPSRLEANINILLTGAPGIGKSDAIEQIAKENDYKLIICHPVISDPTDFKGLPCLIDGKAVFIPFSDLAKMISADKKTLVFFDDLGQACGTVQAALMQIILARRIGENKISESCRFIAATNRTSDRAGVSGILSPLLSRFEIIELETSTEDFSDYCYNNNINSILPAFINFKPEMLHSFKPTTQLINQPNPRNYIRCNSIINDYLSGIYTISTAQELIKGNVGEAASIELTAFIKIWESLPNISAILAGEEVETPSDLSTKYALIAALDRKATKENVKHIIKYLERCGKEYAIVFLKQATKTNPALCACQSFVDFAIKSEIKNLLF